MCASAQTEPYFPGSLLPVAIAMPMSSPCFASGRVLPRRAHRSVRGISLQRSVPVKPGVSTGNALLDALPAADLHRLVARCERIQLVRADVLHVAGKRMVHVYFPVHGVVALVMAIDKSSSVEVALIGSEGMVGVPLVLDADVSPVRALVQRAGSALRMDAPSFSRELARDGALRGKIVQYAFVHLCQLAQTAACTRFHVVEARLARWLLMTQDRARTDTFQVTQEFLGAMLGVRRVGITKAARSLQTLALIEYSRGTMTIVDRRGLRAAACGC
jgi:CRP-like cAMP-binding protein